MITENSVLNARYRLEKKIGQGGFAQVYLTMDQLLKRRVAVKVLNSELTEDENFLGRFEREAQSIAALEHPNILTVYDYGQAENTAYLVTPYVEGGTLHDKLRKEKKFSLEQASQYLTQVAAALDYAHRRFIVHRDIKPQNMLLRSEDDRLLLGDFGIAKVLSSSSAQSRTGVMGTISYMAPEQLEGNVGVGTDIYALGCVLFQMLTGELPYNGATEQVMMGHIMRPIPSIIERSQGQLPQSVQDIINRALAKKPEDRFASAGEMAKAFQAVATGSSGSYSFGATLPSINPAQPGGVVQPMNFQGQTSNFTAPGTGYDRTQVAGQSGQYTRPQPYTAPGTPPHGVVATGTPPHGTPPFGVVPPGGTPPGGYGGTPQSYSNPQGYNVPPPKKSNTGLYIGVAAIVLVAIAAVLLIILLTKPNNPGTPTPVAAVSPTTGTATTTAAVSSTAAVATTAVPVSTAAVATTAAPTTAAPTTAAVDPIVAALKDANDTFYVQGDLQGGLTKFRKLTTDNPSNAKVWRDYGLALYLFDRDAGGIEPLEKSLQYDTKDPLTYLYLVDVYGSNARYTDAQKAAKTALQLDPNGWIGHSAQASYLTYVYKLTDAKSEIEDFQKATVPAANQPYANWLMAVNLFFQEDYQGSAAAMDKTLAAWSNLPSAIAVRASIYLFSPGGSATLKDNQAKALELYQKAQKLAPESASINANLAEYYLNVADDENAEKYANVALQKSDNNATAHYVLGAVLYYKKDYPGSYPHFDRCTQIDPNNAICYYYWGVGLTDESIQFKDAKKTAEATKNLDQALDKAKKAVSLIPSNASYNWGLGFVYFRQNKLTDAISSFQKAIASAPGDATYYGWLGIAYFDNNQKPQAQTEYNKGAAIDPNDNIVKALKDRLDGK